MVETPGLGSLSLKREFRCPSSEAYYKVTKLISSHSVDKIAKNCLVSSRGQQYSANTLVSLSFDSQACKQLRKRRKWKRQCGIPSLFTFTCKILFSKYKPVYFNILSLGAIWFEDEGVLHFFELLLPPSLQFSLQKPLYSTKPLAQCLDLQPLQKLPKRV